MFALELEKNEETRLGFDEFRGLPYEQIPDNFIFYAALDVIATYYLYDGLLRRINRVTDRHKDKLLTHNIQLMGALALYKIHKRGIGFDLEAKDKYLKGLDEKLEQQTKVLEAKGLVRKQKGYQAQYEKIVTELGIELPKTPTGKISAKREDLEQFRDNEFINALLTFKDLEKTKSFVVKNNKARLHPYYKTMVNTGRTACSSPNVQQLPRKEGIRELFIPAKDHAFYVIDYSQLELCTLAQTCYENYGHSRMRELINEGIDLHRYFASQLLNKPITEVTKNERQSAKAVMFGYPGGLGIRAFRDYAASTYGVSFTNSEARNAKSKWLETFPEMQEHLDGENVKDTWTITGRKRGNCKYTASKNTPFQGLASDGAKIALYRLERAGYRIVAFIHDEVILEVPNEKNSTQFFDNACKIMVDAMREVVPDVKIKVEGFVTDKWRKESV